MTSSVSRTTNCTSSTADNDYLVCQVWYYLGKVTSTENVPDDYYYDPATKAERLRILTQMEAEMERELEGEIND